MDISETYVDWRTRIEWYEGMAQACMKRNDDTSLLEYSYWKLKATLARVHISTWRT